MAKSGLMQGTNIWGLTMLVVVTRSGSAHTLRNGVADLAAADHVWTGRRHKYRLPDQGFCALDGAAGTEHTLFYGRPSLKRNEKSIQRAPLQPLQAWRS
jgi:hypothetical protein